MQDQTVEGPRLRLSKPAPGATNPPCELDILLHDCDAFCVDSTEVRVLEQVHQKGFRRFL